MSQMSASDLNPEELELGGTGRHCQLHQVVKPEGSQGGGVGLTLAGGDRRCPSGRGVGGSG